LSRIIVNLDWAFDAEEVVVNTIAAPVFLDTEMM
jgi:hypothetical protein